MSLLFGDIVTRATPAAVGDEIESVGVQNSIVAAARDG